MNIQTFHSSSTGNLYQVNDLLIDPGVSAKKVELALNFDLHNITGCLCSHAHKDHSKGLKGLTLSGVDCYMTKDTADALDLSGHRVHIIEAGKQFRIGSWQILPFELVHDVPCVGFLASSGASGQTKLLFATDSQFVPFRFVGLTHILLECNYSMDILKENLKNGLDREAAKRTIKNHMSLETCKEFFKANDMSKVQEIWLLHLSAGNSNAEMFKNEIMKLTGRPCYIAGE